jgi:hypothetical protein
MIKVIESLMSLLNEITIFEKKQRSAYLLDDKDWQVLVTNSTNG